MNDAVKLEARLLTAAELELVAVTRPPEIERQSIGKHDAVSAREKIEVRVREDGGGRDFAALFAECEDVPADQIPADLLTLKADRDNTS